MWNYHNPVEIIFGEKKLDNIDIIFSISHLETLFKFVFRIDLKEKNFSKVEELQQQMTSNHQLGTPNHEK